MKIEKLEITKVIISDKYKDGRAIMSFGKPAKKVAIKTKQYDKWLSSYPTSKPDDDLLALVENIGIEAIVWEHDGFLNFKLPTRLDKLEARIEVLEKSQGITKSGENLEGIEEEINPENLPF